MAEQNGLEEESGSVVLAEDSLDLGLDSLDTSREVEWLGGMDVDALVEELSAQPTSVNEACAIPLKHIENDCELLTSLETPGELVHVNNCEEFKKDTVMVYRLVVSAEEHNVDTDKPRLSGKRLGRVQEAEINSVKSRWKHVRSATLSFNSQFNIRENIKYASVDSTQVTAELIFGNSTFSLACLTIKDNL